MLKKLCIMLIYLIPFISFAERLQPVTAESENRFEQWTHIASDCNNNDLYIDVNTITSSGNISTTWVLNDYAESIQCTANDFCRSAVSYNRYDCEERTIQILRLYGYLENMGKGRKILVVSNPASINRVLPNSMCEIIYNIACAVKP